jgi:thioredoxin-related protein
MKVKTILFCCLLLGINAIAQKVNFVDNNWQTARARAEAENKLLFVDAYTDWCYWCKVMDKKTFADTSVVTLMNENVVSLKLEMERDYGVKVAMKYRVSGFPSFLVFAPDGSLLYKTSGYMEVEAFKSFLNKTIAKENIETRHGVSKEVELSFPQFYSNAFGKSSERKKPDVTTVQQYIDGEKDLLSEVNFSVIGKFAHLLSQKQTTVFVSNVSQYQKLFGKTEVEAVLDRIGGAMIAAAEKNSSNSEFEAAIDFFKNHKSDFTTKSEAYMRIEFNKNTGKWSEFAGLIDKLGEVEKIDAGTVNSWAWAVYEKCSDKAVIGKAIAWSVDAIKQKADYPILDTYAALLYKSGRKHDAEKAAIIAIETGKKEGADTKETTEMMKKYGSKAPNVK